MAGVIPKLAETVEARRRELRLSPGEFAERSGLTRQGLGRVRKGEDREYQDSTINGVAAALQWGTDWLDRIRAGKQPRVATPEPPASALTQPDEILLPSLVELAHQVERIDLDANRQHVATLATNAKIDDLVEVVADLSRRLAVLEARPGRRSSD